MKYSPTTGGFYPEDFPQESQPGDLIEVSDADYEALFVAQGEGKVIIAGDGGVPIAVDPAVPAPTLAEQALTLLNGGVAVTSTGMPARSGTYSADANTQQEILGEMVSILANGTFTDGTDTIAWPDGAGATHNFDLPGFKELSTVIGAFAQPCLRIIRTGTGTLPPATATIS
jgi:hypothetical protein